jgi:hypothetical protein
MSMAVTEVSEVVASGWAALEPLPGASIARAQAILPLSRIFLSFVFILRCFY